ncbi:hypothetical protein LWI28_004896 [Acer negundo]|uniref:Xylanase inhibitor N-terminal domain-containing protein n=1 Tax=Acer negundo TaxID=4023 RepID=A0AAD5J3A0_ACENE|nr:hypothetical protein LWI28_004896 [Acer negundo]
MHPSANARPEVVPSNSVYLVKIGVGVIDEYWLVLDTGSHLSWIQCKPCLSCFDQEKPIYNPKFSDSFGQVSCTKDISCHPYHCVDGQCVYGINYGDGSVDGQCIYGINYGDGSVTSGYLAFEYFTFTSSDTKPFYFNMKFGCSYESYVKDEFEAYFARYGIQRAYSGCGTSAALCFDLPLGFNAFQSMTYHFFGADLYVEPEHGFLFTTSHFAPAITVGDSELTILGSWQQQNTRRSVVDPSDAGRGSAAQPGTKQGGFVGFISTSSSASSPLHHRLHLHSSAALSNAGDGKAGLTQASLHTIDLLSNLPSSSTPPVFSLTQNKSNFFCSATPSNAAY